MATKFRVFSGSGEYPSGQADKANEFIAEVEANGGEYVGSHSTLGGVGEQPGTVSRGAGLVFALTVVYREKSDEEA